jgi:hypothetical protein
MAAEQPTDDWNAAEQSDPNEHRHTYRNNEGEERSLVANTHHVPVEDAAEELEIEDTDAWSWVLTEGHALDGGIAPTAIPCAECGDPIWGSRSSAARNRGEVTVRCGPCVRARDESANASRQEGDDE